jgi:hypothetical protein
VPGPQPADGFVPAAALISATFMYYHAAPVLSTAFFITSFPIISVRIPVQRQLPDGFFSSKSRLFKAAFVL